MDLFSLHFIRPLWLLCLPLAVILPLAWRQFRRPSGDWSKVCDAHLLRWLSVGEKASKPSWTGFFITVLCLALVVLALSGPSGQQLPDTSFSARDSRVLVIDLSASMLAEDLKPSRLTQVRYRLVDMLQSTREGQMGLVAYAGDAYVVSPLTSDMNTISNMLPALQPDIIPVAGSRADRALALAADLLTRAGMNRGQILLITDSATASDAAMAAELAARGITTSVLAVGTTEGAPIPSGNGFVSDSSGSVVISRLELESLAAVAAAGLGRISQLSVSSSQASPWQDSASGAFSLRDDALGERWKDFGPWLILVLLPFVAAGFRRGLLFSWAALLLPGLMMSTPVEAGTWDDLWSRRDQQAQTALQQKRADDAARLAKDPELAGEAFYRNEDYQRAVQAWARSDSPHAAYNIGNALALAGDYDAAIAAYDRALAEDPEFADALYNRALVEQLKEQQQQQQDQEGEQGESSEEDAEGQPDSEQQGEGEPQEGEEQEGEQQPEDGEPSEQEMEMTWSEEDAQAMEQWLRRIPDDPGGLLRRKFRNQHQKRGAPEDEKQTW